MNRKPSRDQAVKLPWEVYRDIKDEALSEDTTIKNVLLERIEGQSGEVEELRERNRKLKNNHEHCVEKNKEHIEEKERLKKEVERLKEEESEWEEASREELMDSLTQLEGIGELTAEPIVDAFIETENVKVVFKEEEDE